jgi:hypothetical protein
MGPDRHSRSQNGSLRHYRAPDMWRASHNSDTAVSAATGLAEPVPANLVPYRSMAVEKAAKRLGDKWAHWKPPPCRKAILMPHLVLVEAARLEYPESSPVILQRSSSAVRERDHRTSLRFRASASFYAQTAVLTPTLAQRCWRPDRPA